MNDGTPRPDSGSTVKRALAAIATLEAKVQRLERERRELDEPIAIVSSACRFPGRASDPEAFWELLRAGRDAVGLVPKERWDVDALYDADPLAPGRMNSRWGAFVEDVDRFDAPFFGISRREAVSLDPQQRLLLEVAWEALERGGIPADRLRGTRTGVFVGMYTSDYASMLAKSARWGGDAYAVTGSGTSFAAGRLAHLLDLQGPAMVIDTACSSALVAVDAAVKSLRAKSSDTAIVGAVTLVLAPETSALVSKLFVLSPEGRSKTFDASADGYVRGEGCGVVVLKRLSDAVAAGDEVLAVIRGTAVNQDGQSTSLTAPNVLSQEALLRSALDDAGVAPSDVSYVEVHATGSRLGDPIEVDALKAVLGGVPGGAGASPCVLGSVKTNIGHLDAAAGMAGLLKVVASLGREEIPPNLHLEKLNPEIALDGTRFVVPTEARAWPRGERPRIAGVSAFGLSGTNAHVVLEEAPPPARRARGFPPRALHVLPVSARSDAALLAAASRLADRIEGLASPEDLEAACFTASVRRPHHAVRACVVGSSAADLAAALRTIRPSRSSLPPRRRTVVFAPSSGGDESAARLRACGLEPAAAADADQAIVVELGDERHQLPDMEGAVVIRPERAGGNVTRAALEVVAAAYTFGAEIVWERLHPSGGRVAQLPTYPWQRERYWLGDEVAAVTAAPMPVPAVSVSAAGTRPFALEAPHPGLLETLVHREIEPRAPGPGEVAIEVRAAGLNFFDVLKALGIVPGATVLALGGECAGTIVAVGAGVDTWKIGDEVVAIASGAPAMATHLITNAHLVAKKPASLGFVEAAGLPIAFATAVYALEHVARLGSGERVLVHLASGGVGLAAVQIARQLGAEVLATAGSDRKRAHLRALGIEHVMDSRSTAFQADVGEAGVDVVLNSLTGDAVRAGLATLAPYGRFVEIGKKDIYEDRNVGLYSFRRNVTYAAVDVAAMAVERPEKLGPILAEIMRRIDAGELSALPVESFAAGSAVEAFERMRDAQHIGKIVLTYPDASALVASRDGVSEPPRKPAPLTTVHELVARTFKVHTRDVAGTTRLTELGVDSLTALELRNRIATGLGVVLPPARLLAGPTVAALADEVAAMRGAAPARAITLASSASPPSAHRYEPFPLTDIQQAYWVGRAPGMDLGSVGCHAYLELEQTGLDPAELARAWRSVVLHHEMLRAIVMPDGRQRILERVPDYEMAVHDLRGRTDDEVARALAETRARLTEQVFTPSEWPLFEIVLSRLPGDRVRTHFSFDFITADPSTVFRMFADWGDYYRDPARVPAPPALSFRDYVLGAIAYRETEDYARSKRYWQSRIPTLPPAPELPLARSVDAKERSKPRFVNRSARLDRGRWQRLKDRAAEAGVTPTAVLLAAFAAVLERWSASPRFTINLTHVTRLPLHPEVHEIIGDFTSTVLVESASASTFLERARRMHARLLEDLDHVVMSGVEVLREIARVEGSMPLMPIVFTSMLGKQYSDAVARTEWLGETVARHTQTPQVTFDHQVMERRGELHLMWDTVDAIFQEGVLDGMFEAYTTLLDAVSGDAAWERVELTLPKAQRAVRTAFNATSAPPEGALLHGLFGAQAARTPRAPAVISPQKTLDYAELDARSNRVARWLRAEGARPNQLVAVVMEKGWEQIVAVLGILKAGAAYLPIDPTHPAERIAYLLEHGQVRSALTQSTWHARTAWPAGVSAREVDRDEAWASFDDGALESVLEQGPEDLAYVLYTSGSTGAPKGVAMPHRGAVTTCLDVNRRLGVGAEDRAIALSALWFDLSVYDVFGLLAAGGAIVLPDAASTRDPAHWLTLLRDAKVTLWNTVPALMQMLVEHGQALPPSLRLVMMSGDWIPVALPERVRALGASARVVSLGGPTEAAIWQAWFPIERVDPSWASIPYGTPLTNHRLYVLDEQCRERPDWATGEVYIGGLGLAHGYWRDEERTAAAFVTHPVTGERLYRSGDLARHVAGGTLEFVGRNDHQVKIQGHRIELGEVEAALRDHADVAAAVVVARGASSADKRLVAYVVPKHRPGKVTDSVERLLFKLSEPAIRKLDRAVERVALDGEAAPLTRRSHRRFGAAPFEPTRLARLLGALRATPDRDGGPMAKFAYPSAGHLYPVQVYVHVKKGRVDGLAGGLYYYHPKEHELARLAGDAEAPLAASLHAPTNREIAEGAAFALYLVGSLAAIEPLYGELSREFCVLEAGYIGQLLMTAADHVGLGLCPIGTVDVAPLRASLGLGKHDVLVHSFLGGDVASLSVGAAAPTVTTPATLERELRDLVARKLPAYMAPSAIVLLDALPLTANGKVDRARLPAPEAPTATREGATATTDTERQLVELMRDTLALGEARIDVDAGFFELGINSLQLVRLSVAFRERWKRELPLVQMFQHPTIRRLATHLEGGEASVLEDASTVQGKDRAEARRARRSRRE